MNAPPRIAVPLIALVVAGGGCAKSNPAPDLAAGPASTHAETFRFVPPTDSEIRTVSLRGSFNGWGESAMTRQADGSWTITLPLAAGEYQYKFFIDGEWPLDMELGPMGPIDPDADGYVPDG